jgi:hypothetical protein
MPRNFFLPRVDVDDVDKLYLRSTLWARSNRRKETLAEAALWALLRNRQLLGQKFRRQHPIGRYFADFYCPALRLVIEADGPPTTVGPSATSAATPGSVVTASGPYASPTP